MAQPVLSAIKAVENLYATLNPTAFPAVCGGVLPPIYLDEAPVTTQGSLTSVQQRVPYVILKDMGEEPVPGSYGGMLAWDRVNAKYAADGGFLIECYAQLLGDADAINFAILFNGQDPSMKAGLALAKLLLDSPYYAVPDDLVPMRCVRSYAGFNYNNQRCHVTRQFYTRRVYLNENHS